MAETPTDAFVVRPELQGFIPELDGVRALAILGVYATHACRGLRTPGVHQLDRFGWTGVDLFFVLSGFLITGILLESRSQPHALRNFYARRALRIWPVYYAFLFFAFYVAPGVLPGLGVSHGQYPIWFFAIYLQNLVYLALLPGGLWFTWSLCIEEQFYMIWPAFATRLRLRPLLVTCLAVLAGSCLLRVGLLWSGVDPIAIFVSTLTHLDGLMAGAALAIWMRLPEFDWDLLRHATRWLMGTCLGISALLLGFGSQLWPGSRFYGYDITFLPLALGFTGMLGMVLVSRRQAGWFSRFLVLPPLRYVGKISYGIYVLHLAVLSLFRGSVLAARIQGWRSPWLSDLALLGLEAMLVMGVASLSWYAFERPILRLKRFFASPSRRARSLVEAEAVR